MKLAGVGRTVKRSDHVVPELQPASYLPRGSELDVRLWRRPGGVEPLLLVTTSRKTGIAARRNQFRRRVRMAFIEILLGREMSARDLVVWVRPGRGKRCGHPVGYPDILLLLRQALQPLLKVDG